jgi:hypothetical protein
MIPYSLDADLHAVLRRLAGCPTINPVREPAPRRQPEAAVDVPPEQHSGTHDAFT